MEERGRWRLFVNFPETHWTAMVTSAWLAASPALTWSGTAGREGVSCGILTFNCSTPA
jgi:hypothetical protein